jgi:hypothetical protein
VALNASLDTLSEFAAAFACLRERDRFAVGVSRLQVRQCSSCGVIAFRIDGYHADELVRLGWSRDQCSACRGLPDRGRWRP